MCELMLIQGETFLAQRANLSKTCKFENSEYNPSTILKDSLSLLD